MDYAIDSYFTEDDDFELRTDFIYDCQFFFEGVSFWGFLRNRPKIRG